MRTVTYKSVLRGALALAGIELDTALAEDLTVMKEFLAEAIKTAHEYWRWPELMLTEGRFFRAEWAIGSYPEDTEIYHAATDMYWVANTATTGSDVPGVSTKWDELTEFNRYVAFDQEGETPIEAVLEAWDSDPRTMANALPLFFRIANEGVRFATTVPNQVFLDYRQRCPDFLWSDDWSAASFASDAIVYHDPTGEVYQANTACVAGDVPGASAKWDKLDVPYFAASAVKRLAYGDWLEADGQTDKALIYSSKGAELLEEQVWQFTKLQGQTGRPIQARS